MKEKDKHQPPISGGTSSENSETSGEFSSDIKTQKSSITDPESRTFKALYEKVKPFDPSMIIADAGYQTPAIARRLLLDGIEPLFPYKRPMTKEGYFRTHEYVYDEYYNCYLYSENQVLFL